ncbi:MAG: GTPase Era [Limnochordia bacterium]
MDYRSGFVAVIGRPNVGKSTMLNQLLGQKVTIVSDKPQTTRNQIRCVLSEERGQIIFIDTPGLHKPLHKLGEYMVKVAKDALEEVDIILWIVDGTTAPGPGDRYIAAEIKDVATPQFLVINKADQIDDVQTRVDQYRPLGDFTHIAVVSALENTGLEALVDELFKYLPPGPQYYPEDWVSDHPEQFVVAELIREKALELTFEEVPHAVAVEIEEMARREDRDLVDIRATIYVERDSQKGIVIGKGGQMLREIGSRAREDVEKLLGSQVNLQLWVKVKRDWRDREGTLNQFGYS